MSPLIAAAIHDAKNGLNILNTWLEEARREAPSTALDQARITASRISAQLVELLALYRAGENSLRLAVEDHDLLDFCRDVVDEIVLPADARARIEVDVSALSGAGGGGVWAFDAYLVKLALQDALRNALRHARERIVLRVGVSADKYLGFSVEDDGPGFDGDTLDGETSVMTQDSSGLGLAFARLIATRHSTPDGRHGRLQLHNQASGGAVFFMELP